MGGGLVCQKALRQMLLRFIGKANFFIALLLLLIILLISYPPPDQSALAAFFNTPPGCPTPCWQGIRPGVTTAQEAMDLLAAHPWVASVTATAGISDNPAHPANEGVIYWDWNGQQMPVLGAFSLGGSIDVRENHVRVIKMVTAVPFAEIWYALGWPDEGSLRPSRSFGELYDVHLALYKDRGMMVRSIIPQPISLYRYWNAQVEILIQTNLIADTRYRLPCWLAC